MIQYGIGAMLGALTGNASTVAAYQGALGKGIVSAHLEDDRITLRFLDGTGIVFRDDAQSCCERRYMRTDDNLSDLHGKNFSGAEVKDGPSEEDPDSYECHDVQFLELRAEDRTVTISSHNEHNGYYGGFDIVAETLLAEPSE